MLKNKSGRETKTKMWLLYAVLAALTAALVAIFAKLGLKDADPVLATTARSFIMTAFLLITVFALGKFSQFSLTAFSGKDWILISLAGVAGALSWLFYFFALREGEASAVAAIDRLSIVFVIVLAAIVLSEKITWATAIGAVLVFLGAIMISFREEGIARAWAYLLKLIK